ncbi:hypothetical protein CR513_40939, partial [Mucuna pruriens]
MEGGSGTPMMARRLGFHPMECVGYTERSPPTASNFPNPGPSQRGKHDISKYWRLQIGRWCGITLTPCPKLKVVVGVPHHAAIFGHDFLDSNSIDDDIVHVLHDEATTILDLHVHTTTINCLARGNQELLPQLNDHATFEYNPQCALLDNGKMENSIVVKRAHEMIVGPQNCPPKQNGPKFSPISKKETQACTPHTMEPTDPARLAKITKFGQVSRGRQNPTHPKRARTLRFNQINQGPLDPARGQESHALQERGSPDSATSILWDKNLHESTIPEVVVGNVPQSDTKFKAHDLEMHDISKVKDVNNQRARVNRHCSIGHTNDLRQSL